MLKKVGIVVAVLVVVLVGAVIVVPRMIDWNGYKPDIAAAVRDATGRDLDIAGDVEISVLPGAQFAVSGVTFANAEGMEPANMATIAQIEGSIELLPLMGGKLVVERLVIQDPVITLQVDAEGRANWAFAGKEPVEQQVREEPAGEGSPVGDIQLDDVRIEGGRITYTDARTGQQIEATDLRLAAALPEMSRPLTIDGGMTLNGEPVSLKAGVDTPARLLDGERAAVTASIDSQRLKMSYDGGVQQKPVPGLDGTFDLKIPSAGALAAWLDRPLPKEQPDPGPVEVHAVFEADGGTVAIREATLRGETLDASATGTLDISGEAPRLSLQVESGVLDIDRYLPPPVKGAPADAPVATVRKDAGNVDLMAGISDEPFDLSVLRNGQADVRISISGIKAAGYEIGKTLFVATLENGSLSAGIEELNLYGGGITGTLRLDAANDNLTMDTALDVKGVQTAPLSAAVPGGESPVKGKVSAALEAQGGGASPKALVESLRGKLAVDLGGLDLGSAAPGAVSGLKVDLDLPGIEKSPTLAGSIVFNKEKVDFKATVDPLPVVMSAERFDLDASVTSKPMTMHYKGAVLRQPVAGLDGAFDMSIPSVGRLAGWLGTPLAAGQPDPGPLKARAVFAGEGSKVTIKEAVIEGNALKATASGSWSQEGEKTHVTLDAKAGVVDLDRYLPKSPGDAKKAVAAASSRNPADSMLDSLPGEPLDLSMLRSLDADVDVSLEGLKVSGQEIGRTAVAAQVKGGVLTAEIRELAIRNGSVKGQVSLNASREVPSFSLALDAANVALSQFLPDGGKAGTPEGTVSATVKAEGQGASPRALVAGSSADIQVSASGLVIPGEPPRRIEQANIHASVPGLDKPVSAEGTIRYEKEDVKIALSLDAASKILGGERFAAKVSIESAPVTAQYDGAVQQKPVAGLDGRMNVNVPAVGRLMAWLGQPLPSGQSEPGPLEVSAVLAADGPRIALKEATIKGKALQATATASYDGSAERPHVEANVSVDQADLDAYLPAPAGATAKKAGTAGPAPGAGGWSTEPIDLGVLSSASGSVQIALNGVRYRGLEVQSGRVRTELNGGVLNAAIEQLQLAGGTVAGKAKVDASSKALSVDYDLTVSGVNARPLLTAFAGTDRLSGTTELRVDGSARGANQKELVSTLNGKGDIRFLDGAIHGVNLAALVRQVGTLGVQGSEEQKTDFAELGGSFTIKNGLIDNPDLKMLAPLIRLAGSGTANLPPRTIDYRVDAKLVASLQGQGGDDALAGLPVPIRIGGTFDKPTYEIDWKSVLQDAASDPERLKNLPNDLLGTAKGLGVKLPDLGGSGGLGGVLKSLPGGLGGGGGGSSSTSDQPSPDPLKQLFGGGKRDAGKAPAADAGKDTAPTTPPDTAPAPSVAPAPEGTQPVPEPNAAPAESPAPEQKQDPVGQLRGLFGR